MSASMLARELSGVLNGVNPNENKKARSIRAFCLASLAPLLSCIERDAYGIRLLPHGAFRPPERASDASCRCLAPGHRFELANVCIRPIAANPSLSSCHFINLRLGKYAHNTGMVITQMMRLISIKKMC